MEQDDRVRQQRIEALAREIAETINAGPVEQREELRDAAGDVLRDTVDVAVPLPDDAPGQAATRDGSFNPFGIGIPLILMGSVMVFLFPPVGLLSFGVAAMMIAWVVGSVLLARG